MKRNFGRWAIGDSLTKIACGIFGGTVVTLYYNAFVLTPEKTNKLFLLYWILTIFAIVLSLIGYFMIQRTDTNWSCRTLRHLRLLALASFVEYSGT